MLLALWPALIAMPETANYALLDQQKRDERRLAAKKKQIADELASRRLNVSTDDVFADERLVAPVDAIIGNITERSIADGILGYDTDGMRDGRGLSVTPRASIAEIVSKRVGVNDAMKRRNEEAFILILANI